MNPQLLDYLALEIDALKENGLYKDERVITSAQQAAITVGSENTVLNFCANNYLGLANHPRIVEALVSQARQLNIVSRAFYTDRLADLNPQNLGKYDAVTLYANIDQIGKPQADASIRVRPNGSISAGLTNTPWLSAQIL